MTSTHSAECWRWHHECAVARIEAVLALCDDADAVAITERWIDGIGALITTEVRAAIEGEST